MASPYDLPQSPMRSREAALGALHHLSHHPPTTVVPTNADRPRRHAWTDARVALATGRPA
eukprot:CAMPEP_0119533462 /NCGR_PEP_ID=MMETSP1344-20130328/46853_1 /TAXON_ID=236787 /ORGANISM="Florenciella parvula, Strain CCMP2471" /LENGTH=59 /DNA_ID=CAMNT_0007574355 /DNA_START=6 /DNA_END=181 /DNA_ORIENTATION=-